MGFPSKKTKVLGFLMISSMTAFATYVYLTDGAGTNFEKTHMSAQSQSDQATAPQDIIVSTIADMPKDSQAPVAPESLVIDENQKVWLNKHQPINVGDSGIVVHYLKNGTYEVEIKDDKLRWIKVPLTDELKKALVPVRILHLPKK